MLHDSSVLLESSDSTPKTASSSRPTLACLVPHVTDRFMVKLRNEKSVSCYPMDFCSLWNCILCCGFVQRRIPQKAINGFMQERNPLIPDTRFALGGNSTSPDEEPLCSEEIRLDRRIPF